LSHQITANEIKFEIKKADSRKDKEASIIFRDMLSAFFKKHKKRKEKK
tara:strand:- start:583 stop:726 length:144 start_codon:yes stop_codon:yes gene_type:complete